MLNSRFRALAAVMAFATAALAGCGGDSGGGGSASVRLVNATLTHASIDLLANGDSVVTGTAKDTVSEFAGVDDGSPASGAMNSASIMRGSLSDNCKPVSPLVIGVSTE